MTWRDLIQSAWTCLSRHKLRSALALSGVTLGAMLLFCSLAGGLGVLSAVTKRLSAGDRLVQIVVVRGEKVAPVTEELARSAGIKQNMPEDRRLRIAQALRVGGSQPVPMNLDAIPLLQAIPHVESAWADLGTHGTVELEHTSDWGHAVFQANPPHGKDISPLIVCGRDLKPSESESVLVSELLLYQLGIHTERDFESVIGTTIRISPTNTMLEQASAAMRKLKRTPETPIIAPNGKTIRWEEAREKWHQAKSLVKTQTKPLIIAGVFRAPTEEEVQLHPQLAILASRQLVLHYDQAVNYFRLIKANRLSVSAVVQVDAPERVRDVESAILDMGFRTRSLAHLALQIRTAVLLITAIVTTIAIGALLIASIGIANTMIMNVLERRGEIAIMKSIGARDKDINRMFLTEGLLMGAIGGTVGLLLGLVFARVSGGYIRALVEQRLNEPLGSSVFSYPVWLIIGTPLVAALVTTMATWIPARRAAKLDPVVALREL